MVFVACGRPILEDLGDSGQHGPGNRLDVLDYGSIDLLDDRKVDLLYVVLVVCRVHLKPLSTFQSMHLIETVVVW